VGFLLVSFHSILANILHVATIRKPGIPTNLKSTSD
jgi:hypothetical protein